MEGCHTRGMSQRLGPMTVHALVEGRLALDGGAMFGVVPRTLWERRFPPDERNRISLVTRSMLVEVGARLILVDLGMGTRWDGKHRAMYGIEHGANGLDTALTQLGRARQDVTDVVLSHLHFDAAGGTTREEGGELRLSFPRATVHVQRRHWKWAHQPSKKDAGSFRRDDFALLERSGLLHLMEGATELYPGVNLFVSEGHPAFSVHLGAKYATAEKQDLALTTGAWHHLAGVFDGREVRLYLDGTLVDSTKASGKRDTNALPLVVGGDVTKEGASANTFDGELDEVRLSQSARYSGKSFTPARRLATDADTLLWLPMDGPLGPWIPDHSGHGAFATRVGSPRLVDAR